MSRSAPSATDWPTRVTNCASNWKPSGNGSTGGLKFAESADRRLRTGSRATRQRLIERTEEARAFHCKAAEATIARAAAERRLAALQVARGIGERGDEDPTESRTALSEYLRALNLKSREMALAGSAGKLAALSDRNRHQAADRESPRAGNGIEDVMAALAESGGQPRSDIEDALDAARKANARLESEVASLRSGFSDAAGLPSIAMPSKVETRTRKIEPPKVKRSKSEPPRSPAPLNGMLTYESGLVAQLRRRSDEDDAARSVA